VKLSWRQVARRLTQGRIYPWLRGLVYVLASLFVFGMWATDVREFVSLNGYYRATLLDMVKGTAYRPFSYRCLVPAIVRSLLALLPDVAHAWLSDVVGGLGPVQRGLTYLSWEQSDLPVYLAALLTMYGFLLGSVYALRQLVRELFAGPEWFQDVAPLAALTVLPVFFKRGTHLVYDPATLCLFTLGLVLLHRGSWRWYYVVFAIGVLNKETMILLTVVMAAWGWQRMRRADLARHLGLQAAIFSVLKLGLNWWYRDNPGGLFEPHLYENLRLYMRPYWFGAVWDSLGVVLLIGWHWGKKPLFLRSSLALLLLLFPLYLVAGGYGEIRAFYELFPVLFLLGWQSVCEILGWPLKPVEAGAGRWLGDDAA